MFEANCYDMYGNSIDSFTQWDVNQRMAIRLESCGDENHIDNDILSIEPNVHFSNVKRDKALVVRASVTENNDIVVDVPNILLTEPYPLLIYVYYTSAKEPSAQATIVRTELPVRRRDEPHDYYYVENIERITAEMIKKEIEADTEETRQAAINEINSEEQSAIDAINSKETAAIQAVANKQQSAENTLQTYIDAGNQIKNDTNQIKSETQTIKEQTNQIKSETQTIKEETAAIKVETQGIADATADTITADVYNRIEVVGLQLHTTDDGNGYVTTTIVVPQTE